MLFISERFKKVVCGSAMVSKVRVDVYVDGYLEIEDLPISDGNVTCDDVAIRTTGDLTFHTDEFHPSEANTLLYPGAEYRPYRGLVFPDGTEELLPLGVLRITNTRNDDSGDGYNIRMDATDRASRVADNKFKEPFFILKGMNCVEALYMIMGSQAPWAPLDFVETDETCPTIVSQTGDDPWQLCLDIAQSIGYDMFFDVNGTCVMREAPSQKAEPDWIYSDEEEDPEDPKGSIMYIYKTLSSEHAYSRVVVTGESNSSDQPIRSQAIDDDPTSSTYIYGDFGEKTYTITSSKVHTTTQAIIMANHELDKRRGIGEQVQILGAPNPAHEMGDTIQVVRTKYGTATNYVVGKMTIPLVPIRGQNISMRERHVR